MRNVTIIRRKKFAAKFVSFKVYVEDAYGDTVINGVTCRLLGMLKNDSQSTFPIPEEAVRLFVISDKTSRNFCNDCATIEAGTEDITLEGQCTYDPFCGNPFRFDGAPSEFALQNRKRAKKRGFIVMMIALLVGIALGVILGLLESVGTPSAKTFQADGMKITLTDQFQEQSSQEHTAVYASNDVVLFVTKEPFSLFDGEDIDTLKQYAQLLLENNELTDTPLLEKDHFLYFESNMAEDDGSVSYHFTALFQSNDAFWMFDFSVRQAAQSKYKDLFIEWAKSVSFS